MRLLSFRIILANLFGEPRMLRVEEVAKPLELPPCFSTEIPALKCGAWLVEDA